METIIEEMRKEMMAKEGGGAASDNTHAEEHAGVLEAVKEGLLQMQVLEETLGPIPMLVSSVDSR